MQRQPAQVSGEGTGQLEPLPLSSPLPGAQEISLSFPSRLEGRGTEQSVGSSPQKPLPMWLGEGERLKSVIWGSLREKSRKILRVSHCSPECPSGREPPKSEEKRFQGPPEELGANPHSLSQRAVAKRGMGLGVGRTLGRGSPHKPRPGCLETIRNPPTRSGPSGSLEQGAPGWERGKEGSTLPRATPGRAQRGGDALPAPRGLQEASLAELSEVKPSRAGQYGARPGQARKSWADRKRPCAVAGGRGRAGAPTSPRCSWKKLLR